MPEVTFFAKTNFRNQEAKFGIKTDDRRRHMYVIGKTGMGKTNLLEHMVIQDIQNGHGVAYVDPHGDTAEKLIKAIPSSRINDVIYFNPADIDYPVAFNVMEKVNPEYRHLVASGLVGVFKKIWADSWGPRLEYILRNAILALLEYPGSTLLGVTRMLVDKNYRIRVVNKLTDPVVRSFWVDEFPKWNERVLQEVVSPIQNKVGQFLSSSLIRNIVGQTRSSFDIREIMDDRKILILNLSKGRIGEDNSALLGAMMITKIQLAAMARVDILEEERKDFYLYVDEFQNFATESFTNILSEARKYRLNLILANQYIMQLDEKVSAAIFGNAGTLIAFRVGAVDAEFMEKEFEPIFMMNDLVNLPKYNIYLKLMIDGIAGDAFSATTIPPIDIADTEGNAEKVIKVSRERYASSRVEVEDKIARWSGMIPSEPAVVATAKTQFSAKSQFAEPVRERVMAGKTETQNNQAAPAKPQLVVTEEKRELYPHTNEAGNLKYNKINGNIGVGVKFYDAVCDTCGLKIQVPFEPDGKRPTFCKECLKDYQRVMARSRERTIDTSQRTFDKKEEIPERKRVELKTYSPQERPMTLNQLTRVAPKKFEKRKKAEVNLEEVRKLIRNKTDET